MNLSFLNTYTYVILS